MYMSISRTRGGRLSRRWARSRRQRRRKYVVTGIIVLAAILGLLLTKVVIDNLGLEQREVNPGATFSLKYAEELGLDWREAYVAMLDDLGVRALRLPVYWDLIEQEQDQFNFDDVDWQLQEAAKRGSKVFLAIGMKVPRWPECHIPDWAQGLSEDELRTRIMVMLQETTQHFSKSANFAAWQIENEPFFPFGDCPKISRAQLQREVDLVKSIDDRPIIITDAGELSDWLRAAAIGDMLGISTYRDVWNRYLGHLFWPITPKWYATRLKAVRPLVDEVFVSELQAEPWSPGPIRDWDLNEQVKHMNPDKLENNMAFARRMGVSEVYLWGVEWWYWMKEQGHPEMWEAGKEIFNP